MNKHGKKSPRKLILRTETVRALGHSDLQRAAGGFITLPLTFGMGCNTANCMTLGEFCPTHDCMLTFTSCGCGMR